MREGEKVIRASEIGEYRYCSRAWWYKHVVKVEPPGAVEQQDRFSKGREAHSRHGRSVSLAVRLRILGIALLICGLLALWLAIALSAR
jgi:hypothetical protein